MAPEHLYFNGVNGTTGAYLLPSQTAQQVATLLRDVNKQGELEQARATHHEELQTRNKRDTIGHYGVGAGITASDLAQAGWGVIFAHDADHALCDALARLLDYRRQQAGARKAARYQEFTGARAYRPGDTKQAFLARCKVAAGMPADPDRGVPYYLLIVGPPQTIPYRFQYELDVEYAVGRLWFEKEDGKPDLEAFAQYARGVVAVESGKVALPREAVFFGVRNPGIGEATQLSADYLIKPLVKTLTEQQDERRQEQKDWKIVNVPYEETAKATLGRFLGGAETPALLFTASHGMGFDRGDPRQLADQGALLCQDWPGRDQWQNPIPPRFYFAARDVPENAGLLGLIAFHFACYGAGTPQLDDYPYANALWREGALAGNAVNVRPPIADHPFVARLPQRLLGHPCGGALAVIGHVERAWGCSFYMLEAAREQTQVYEGVLKLLMDGHPVGEATEFLNQRYAAVSVLLNNLLQDLRYGLMLDDAVASNLANLWTAYNDAGAYVIVGDPAVRLPPGSLSAGRPARPDLATIA